MANDNLPQPNSKLAIALAGFDHEINFEDAGSLAVDLLQFLWSSPVWQTGQHATLCQALAVFVAIVIMDTTPTESQGKVAARIHTEAMEHLRPLDTSLAVPFRR